MAEGFVFPSALLAIFTSCETSRKDSFCGVTLFHGLVMVQISSLNKHSAPVILTMKTMIPVARPIHKCNLRHVLFMLITDFKI